MSDRLISDEDVDMLSLECLKGASFTDVIGHIESLVRRRLAERLRETAEENEAYGGDKDALAVAYYDAARIVEGDGER